MIAGPEHGILGLSGHHAFRSGDGVTEVVMRGYVGGPAGLPCIKLDRITGLWGLGDADDFRAALEGRTGEIGYGGSARSKTVIYEGRVMAATPDALRLLSAKLRAIAAGCREYQLGAITVTAPDNPGAGYALGVRTMDFEMDDEQLRDERAQPTPWQRSFMLTVRALDPRAFWWPQNSDTHNANEALVTVENEGTAPAEPSLLLRNVGEGGPGQIQINNNTLQKFITFDIGEDPDWDFVTPPRVWISFEQRAIVRPTEPEPANSPNVDLMPLVVPAQTTWWDAGVPGLAPGENEITVIGSSDWDIYWHHAAW